MNVEDIQIETRQNIALFIQLFEDIKQSCVLLHGFETTGEVTQNPTELLQFLLAAFRGINAVEPFVAEGENLDFLVAHPDAFISLHGAVAELPELFPLPEYFTDPHGFLERNHLKN